MLQHWCVDELCAETNRQLGPGGEGTGAGRLSCALQGAQSVLLAVLCKEITPCHGSTDQCVLLEQEGIAVAKHTDEGKQRAQSQVRPKCNMETPGLQLRLFFFCSY